MSGDGRTYAEIAAALGVSERQAKREVEAAAIRKWMHEAMGLERDDATGRVQINAAVRKATRNPASGHVGFRLARRFPDRMVEDDVARPAPVRSRPRGSLLVLAGRGPSSSLSKGPDVEITTTPPVLIAELEQLPLGDAGFETFDGELTAAIETAKVGPRRVMFPPRLVMVDANTLQMFTWYVSKATAANYRPTMTSLHCRALDDAPDMAPLFRAPETLADLRAAAGSLAFGPDAALAAAEEAIATYERDIARQLGDWTDTDLARAAKEYLALLAIADRQTAARTRHQAARQAAAERAAAEARAAKEAADAAADAAEVENLLTQALQRHGLPGDLRKGIFVEQQRERLQLLAAARRRLTTTASDVVRIGFGVERKVYNPKHLANAIADCSLDELRQVIRAVDQVEQDPGRWS